MYPKEPEHSCPVIDENLSKIDSICNSFDEIEKRLLAQEDYETLMLLEQAIIQVKELDTGFEYCRSQCEALRAWGHEWADKHEDAKYELDELKESLEE